MSGHEPSPWSFPPPDPAHRIAWSTSELTQPLPAGPPPRQPGRGRFALAVALTVVVSALGGFVLGRGIGSALDGRTGERGSVSAPAAPTTAPGTTAPPATVTPPSSVPATPAAPPSTVPAPTTTQGPTAQRSPTSKLDVGVVDIDTKLGYETASAAGTGMILTADGQVLTNNHVIEGATSITVTVVTTGAQYEAVVVGTSPTQDVALLQLQNASGLTPVAVGTASSLEVGDEVTSVGNARGLGGEPTVAGGVVRALDQEITASDGSGGNAEQLGGLIETDARMQPGMSGGPLYDATGKVVGMNTAGSAAGGRRFNPGAASDNYAITIDDALSVVAQIRSGKETDTVQIGPHGFLGVEITSDDPATPGAVVSRVLDGTPAATSGLAGGDVIVSVDGQAVATGEQLGERLRSHDPGDKVTIGWVDAAGQSHTVTVTLIAGPA